MADPNKFTPPAGDDSDAFRHQHSGFHHHPAAARRLSDDDDGRAAVAGRNTEPGTDGVLPAGIRFRPADA